MIPQPKPPHRATAGPTLLLAAALLAGCSPYKYASQVDTVANGISGLGDALASARTADRTDAALLRRIVWAQNRPPLLLADVCRSATVRQDVFCTVDSDPTSITSPTQSSAITGKLNEYIAALHGYATALKAITDAKDRAALDSAAGKLSGAVGGVAALTNPGAPVVALVPVVLTAGYWVVGEALDTQRYYALRDGVRGAERYIPDLARSIVAELTARSSARRLVLRSTAEEIAKGMTAKLTRAEWLAQLDQMQAVTTTLDAVNKADPDALEKALIAAHKALADALEDPQLSLADVETKARKLAAHAAAVHAAFKNIAAN